MDTRLRQTRHGAEREFLSGRDCGRVPRRLPGWRMTTLSVIRLPRWYGRWMSRRPSTVWAWELCGTRSPVCSFLVPRPFRRVFAISCWWRARLLRWSGPPRRARRSSTGGCAGLSGRRWMHCVRAVTAGLASSAGIPVGQLNGGRVRSIGTGCRSGAYAVLAAHCAATAWWWVSNARRRGQRLADEPGEGERHRRRGGTSSPRGKATSRFPAHCSRSRRHGLKRSICSTEWPPPSPAKKGVLQIWPNSARC